MQRPAFPLKWLPLGLALLSCLHARAAVPNIAGAVTAAVSPTDFEVNGIHVLCDAHTKFELLRPSDAGRISWSERPYIGEPLLVYGHNDGHAHLLRAGRVVFAPVEGRVRGKAIIDRILAPQPSSVLFVRADGYPILLTSSTQIAFVAPLRSPADVHTNLWLDYQGVLRADGILVAEKALFHENTVEPREDKLHTNTNYDPSAPPPVHQKDLASGVQGLFASHHPTQILPSKDTAMQSRIDTIGQRLVPRYQRALPDTDPTKIRFRFQLVDDKRASSRIDLPSGAILIPREIIARLQNDDQIAAYLAAGMAAILEKQQLRDAVEKRLLTAGEIGGLNWIAPAFVAANKKDDLETAESEQRMRVSLALMHDAGYNPAEAPKTSWMLAAKKPKPLTEIPIPDESIYTYVLLGSTWRNTAWQH